LGGEGGKKGYPSSQKTESEKSNVFLGKGAITLSKEPLSGKGVSQQLRGEREAVPPW